MASNLPNFNPSGLQNKVNYVSSPGNVNRVVAGAYIIPSGRTAPSMVLAQMDLIPYTITLPPLQQAGEGFAVTIETADNGVFNNLTVRASDVDIAAGPPAPIEQLFDELVLNKTGLSITLRAVAQTGVGNFWRLIGSQDAATGIEQASFANAVGAGAGQGVIAGVIITGGVFQQITAADGVVVGLESGAPLAGFGAPVADAINILSDQGAGTYKVRLGGKGAGAALAILQLRLLLNGAPIADKLQTYTLNATPDEVMFNIEADLVLAVGDLVTAEWTSGTNVDPFALSNFYFTANRES